MKKLPTLKLLPMNQYRGVNDYDPIRYYYWPVFGRMYCRRVEMALFEFTGGQPCLRLALALDFVFLNLCDMYNEIHGLDLTVDIDEVQSLYATHGIKTYLKQGN